MELTVQNAADEVDRFIRDDLPKLVYPAERFADRGVVIAAGGPRLLINAWVAINMLRRFGCTLPVQCWYLGSSEYDAEWARLVAPLDVECVDAHQVRDEHSGRWEYDHARLFGWELKPYAITHCPFEEVLFLDADNVPVVDPTFLFDTPEYRQTGCILWPDFGRLGPKRSAWQVFGNIPYRDEPEVESGQIVIDKRRCWQCLMLCHWYMQNSNNFFFHHVHGDKEVFHLAWRKLDQSYAMTSRGIEALPGVMCQHDFQGRRIFQHRNLRKWKLSGNPTTPGFLYEKECLEYLADLREKWFPAAAKRDLADEDRVAMDELIGRYRYERVGYDQRPMDLDAGGLIGLGASRCEAYWWCQGPQLVIAAEDGSVTCRLTCNQDGYWHGRWENHERMPITLEPLQ